MTDPQVEVDLSVLRGWRWNRGLHGNCRCVYGQPTIARHPECPRHPPLDELHFWGAQTITLRPDSGL